MLPTPLVSVWMGFSSCSDAHVICFTKIGFFVVGVCSNGLKECIWGSYSGIKVTHQNNEIVKWNVTNAVSEVVIQSVLVSRGGLSCWCICANNSYFRITINSNEYIRLLIFLICKMFFSNFFGDKETDFFLRSFCCCTVHEMVSINNNWCCLFICSPSVFLYSNHIHVECFASSYKLVKSAWS